MTASAPSSRVIRFGAYEARLGSGELYKGGRRIKLQDQPFQVLAMLLEHPGELVTREELHQKLWPTDTFVDFDTGLNSAIKRLRDALNDSADEPRYVETLPRHGYRFIAPVDSAPLVRTGVVPQAVPTVPARLPRPAVWMAAGIVAAALVTAGYFARERFWPGARPPAGRVKLAVLPFENLSGDPEQEYFSDGLTEEMITELGRLQPERLGVIARTSAMQYKKKGGNLRRIADELGVDYVLEGSVRREGDRVRISANLIAARDQTHLWAESYERDLAGILSLQKDVAVAIARQIELKLTPQQQARLAGGRPVKPEAYEAYLRGRELYRRWDEAYFDSAAEYLQKAVQADPTFAPPYATLAQVYSTDMRYSWEERHLLAETTAAKALELDDGLAEAHAAMGLVKLRFGWDWAGAEQEFKRAIELNPNSEEAHTNYGYYLVLMGRIDEGIAEFRRAIELDPLNILPNERLAWAYMKARRFDEAIILLLELKRLEPDAHVVGYQLGIAYAHKGMYREALAEVERVKCTLECGWVLAVSGRHQEARKLINELIELSRRKYVDPGLMAVTCAGLGEKDEAIKWLEQSYRLRGRFMIYLKSVHEFDPLRDDPRFQALLRRMNFPD